MKRGGRLAGVVLSCHGCHHHTCIGCVGEFVEYAEKAYKETASPFYFQFHALRSSTYWLIAWFPAHKVEAGAALRRVSAAGR